MSKYTHIYPYHLSMSGPLKSTMEDFWRMLWEQHVPMVVMVTNIIENGKVIGLQLTNSVLITAWFKYGTLNNLTTDK